MKVSCSANANFLPFDGSINNFQTNSILHGGGQRIGNRDRQQRALAGAGLLAPASATITLATVRQQDKIAICSRVCDASSTLPENAPGGSFSFVVIDALAKA